MEIEGIKQIRERIEKNIERDKVGDFYLIYE